MIAYLRGHLIDKTPTWVCIDVAGVGYSVEIPLSTFETLPVLNDVCALYIDMVVREDAMLLYGFASAQEKSLFRLLLKVNGVGPKLALAVLSSLSVDIFVQAIHDKNVSLLTKISGVGKKTAERMVLELATVIDSIAGVAIQSSMTSLPDSGVDSLIRQQAIQALEALGYKTAEANSRVDKSWQEGVTLNDCIKRALQVSM